MPDSPRVDQRTTTYELFGAAAIVHVDTGAETTPGNGGVQAHVPPKVLRNALTATAAASTNIR